MKIREKKLNLNYSKHEWRDIASISLDRIVGVKHSVVISMKGKFTIDYTSIIHYS